MDILSDVACACPMTMEKETEDDGEYNTVYLVREMHSLKVRVLSLETELEQLKIRKDFDNNQYNQNFKNVLAWMNQLRKLIRGNAPQNAELKFSLV